ncbi:hypothetical protein LIA77_00165 [Sarocladium implicatum]|nr:hypothetical protein LIA77_00165 [Sarocladium implicatum]
MLISSLLCIAALAAPLAEATSVKKSYGCRNDACLKAVLGTNNKPCQAECKSFLKITVTPAAKTVFKTVTTTSTTLSRVPATARGTTLVTVTQTESVVETDYESVTATQTNYDTTTVTEAVTITSTTGALPDNPPFKRAINTERNPFLCVDLEDFEEKEKRYVAAQGPVTVRPTKIPTTAKACTNTAAFSSACSCLGVRATTITAPRPTVTKTTKKTVYKARPTTVTVKTVTVTSTAKTDVVTTTYSTNVITTTVQTNEVDLTVATNTVTATSVVEVPPNPVQTVILRAIGSSDPLLATSGGIGFTNLESFRGSSTVYYLDFNNDVSSTLQFGVNFINGELTVLNGPGSSPGEAVYYSTFGGLVPVSYVNVSPQDFATSQGGQAAVCKIAEGQGYEYLQCKWGDNQIAEFWTCAQRLNFAQPGYDFSRACRDASTSYKIPLIQVIRV